MQPSPASSETDVAAEDRPLKAQGEKGKTRPDQRRERPSWGWKPKATEVWIKVGTEGETPSRKGCLAFPIGLTWPRTVRQKKMSVQRLCRCTHHRSFARGPVPGPTDAMEGNACRRRVVPRHVLSSKSKVQGCGQKEGTRCSRHRRPLILRGQSHLHHWATSNIAWAASRAASAPPNASQKGARACRSRRNAGRGRRARTRSVAAQLLWAASRASRAHSARWGARAARA